MAAEELISKNVKIVLFHPHFTLRVFLPQIV